MKFRVDGHRAPDFSRLFHIPATLVEDRGSYVMSGAEAHTGVRLMVKRNPEPPSNSLPMIARCDENFLAYFSLNNRCASNPVFAQHLRARINNC
jgi:hypothetical protein